jgi:hypothetical protein
VPVTIQQVGDLLVGGVVVSGGVQDETTAKGQGLRRGTSAEQGLQLLAQIEGEWDLRGKRPWHNVPPCTRENEKTGEGVIMGAIRTFVQTLAANL